MPIGRFVIVLLISTLVISAWGCSSSSQGPASQPGTTPAPAPAGFSLISPVDALKVPGAVEDTARYCRGDRYDYLLPHLNVDNEDGHQVSAGNPYTNFQPAWDPAAPNPADLAYCIYRLGDLTGYTASRELRFGWMTPPDDWGDFWVGVGNVTHDRWDWFKGPQYPAVLTLGGLTHYISGSGEMLVTVLFTGDGCPTLDWVLLGETVFDIDFVGIPQNGLPPLNVSFNVDADQTIGGYPASYDFDFDGGGFDVLDNLTGTTGFEYTVPGTYDAEVRVNLDNGEQGTQTFQVIVIDPGNTGPLAGLLPVTTMGSAPLTVEFDASDSYDTDGGSIIKYEWDFEMDGTWDRDTGTDPTTSYTFGKAGVNNVMVRVTDNDLAADTDAVLVNVGIGWHVGTADSDARLTDPPSMSRSGILLMTGPYPNVAYRAYASGATNAVRFCRAGDVAGQTWGAPQDIVTGSGKGFGVALRYYVNGLINHYPCITYGVSSGPDMDVVYVGATSTSGAAWNTPLKLNTGENCGSENALGLSDGNPVVLTERGGTLRSLRAVNFDGTSWPGAFVVVDSASASFGSINTPRFMSTTDNATFLPHVGYCLTEGSSSATSLLLRAASDTSCAGWEDPVVITELALGTANQNCSFAVVDGRLAVAYHSGYPAQLYFQRATDDAAATWGEPVLVDGDGHRGQGACLVYRNNVVRPLITYYDWENQNLMAVEGTDSTGANWDEPMVIDSSGDVGHFHDLLICNNVPVVMYSDNTNNDLKFAAWY